MYYIVCPSIFFSFFFYTYFQQSLANFIVNCWLNYFFLLNLSDEDDEDDDEDDEEALLAELERLRKEKAEQKEREVSYVPSSFQLFST